MELQPINVHYLQPAVFEERVEENNGVIEPVAHVVSIVTTKRGWIEPRKENGYSLSFVLGNGKEYHVQNQGFLESDVKGFLKFQGNLFDVLSEKPLESNDRSVEIVLKSQKTGRIFHVVGPRRFWR